MNTLPEEVQEQLWDFINNVPFIRNLISKDRRYAKDMPKDDTGKIIIDFENPHILEDIDYFRQPAIHFEEHGCYTFLKPNSNPNSEYSKFWKREIERCRVGCVRESDGEWVTGLWYFFMNYCPMLVNVVIEGTKKAIRKEAFPYSYEGIYWRFHYINKARELGKHCIELAKRGSGKSNSLAAIMTRNLLLGENEESNKRVITVLTAYQKEYLSGSKDGTLSKFEPMLNYCRINTPFPRLMLKNSPNEMSWQMGYKDEYGILRGNLNQVLGVSAKDNPEKLRGKRGFILFEEIGSFRGLLSLYDITRRSVEDGDYAFATMVLVGTAAESESDFSSAKTLLYSPKGYNLLYHKNVYDKVNQGKDDFGFFFGAYINRAGCYNKDGVSDVIKALVEILLARYTSKYNSSDPNTVLRLIAEDPITPAEAMIKVKAAYFPVQALQEALLEMDRNPRFFDNTLVGDLVLNSSGVVEFKVTSDVPIRQYEGVSNDTPGALEIHAMPEYNSSHKIPSERYIIGFDPVNNDAAISNSLASIIVLDLWTDTIVAEYTGRKSFAEDSFEMARLLCLFYNAKCLYESNNKGTFHYFSKMNSVHLLADTPEHLRDKQMIKYSNYGSNQKGVNASAAINNYANSLIKDWLCKPNTIVVSNEEEDTTITVMNLQKLKTRALIEELIAFNPEKNVDRIRALGMAMLYREEKMILWGGNVKKEDDKILSSYLGNDDFFTNNYRNNKN